jgi:hypothetical protein
MVGKTYKLLKLCGRKSDGQNAEQAISLSLFREVPKRECEEYLRQHCTQGKLLFKHL